MRITGLQTNHVGLLYVYSKIFNLIYIMNTFYAQHSAVARVWAVLTMFAVLLSAFSAPLSAYAEEPTVDPVPTVDPAPTDLPDEEKDKEEKDKEPKKDDPLPDAPIEEQVAALVQSPKVTICHANESNEQANNPFTKNIVDESGLNGHGTHADDIIPVTPDFPNGQNLDTPYPQFGGLTGADILAKNCDVPKPKKELTIIATKIICEDETLLPNDGYLPNDIDENTATEFLNDNQECYLAEDWEFQYALGGKNGAQSPDNSGELNTDGWKPAVSTVNGVATMKIGEDDLGNNKTISVREVMKPGYLPFTGQNGGPVSAELYCQTDAANYDNLDWIKDVKKDGTYHCVAWNVPYLETVEVCKYDALGAPQEGWEMTITNGKESKSADTEVDGCVDFKVNPYHGPWEVTEEDKKDWELVSVSALFGTTKSNNQGEAHNSCEFFGGVIPQDGDSNTIALNEIIVKPEFKCTFTNEFIPPCEDKLNGDWASSVEDSDQKLRKDGSAITDPKRTDDSKVLGASDWVNNGSTGFFSLGFGGSVTVEFDNFVPNVAGDDIAVYEATNGNYPAETALVEVSQDGVTWKTVGSASNQNVGRISNFDFDSTGYTWIKFVRVTDTSDSSLHANDADGFDVDAIEATKSLCDEPEEPKVCTVTIVSDETNTVDGIAAEILSVVHSAWTAVVNAPSKWIWKTDPVEDAVNETTETFLKKFGWNGPVTSAILTIAADNSYEVSVNGDVFGGDPSANNFAVADVHNLTSFIDQGNNELEIAVKNLGVANATPASNPAGLKYELVITGTDAECDIPYEEPKEEVATVVAHKIVCTDEAELPNWGALGGADISSTTAQTWVDTHDSCEFEAGWEFEWAPQGTSNPDNNLPASGLYGVAGGNWTTFGPTDVNGKTQVTLTAAQIAGMSNIWMREVLKDGYIPFTYGPTNLLNDDDYTAEMYCHTDVKNFDNYDRVDGIAVDNTYHCVAWNHTEEPAPVCEVDVNLLANGGFESPEVTDGAGWDIFDSVLGWAIAWMNPTGAPAEASLELHAGVNGWLPVQGDQYAELDSDWQGPGGTSGEAASVAITQTVPTIAGEDYSLSWSFSPRPNTAASQNVLEVLVNNVLVATNTAAGAANTVWTPDNYVFEGTGAPVTITFRDAGISNSEGTLLDNVSLNCRPDDGGNNGGDEDTYRLEGYVWNDDNRNTEWEVESEDYNEFPLAGWTVRATDGEDTYSTTTDEYGYYYFDVPAGTWTISQEVQTDWEQTTEPIVHVVTVPAEMAQSLVERVLAYVIPVAHAAVIETFGDYNFGNDFVGTTPNPTSNGGGGGGGGGRLVRSTPTVAGDSISVPTPTPLVLGEQVTAVPYGAPGTGHGGTSSNTNVLSLFQILFVSRKTELTK